MSFLSGSRNSRFSGAWRRSACTTPLLLSAMCFAVQAIADDALDKPDSVQLGSRPTTLVGMLSSGELKDKLQSCQSDEARKSEFSISHRGAPLHFPEHTLEGYLAAARMGAGIIECDVTFTKDKGLVCRHSQCDLATTTNILATDLAKSCSRPPNYASDRPFADVKCCTSDITVDQFLTLRGKMDAGNKNAKTLEEFLSTKKSQINDLYPSSGTLMTHAQSIELFKSLQVKMIPELKAPDVRMPFDGFSQSDYAQALVNEYKQAGVDASRVFLQSFDYDDVKYWIEHEPEFARQVVYLDGRYTKSSFNHRRSRTWKPSMQNLVDSGVNILAPPLWMLLSTDKNRVIRPSTYAVAAKAAGLEIVPWTLERSGSLNSGGGWYYQSVKPAIKNNGDMLKVLDVLYKDVGIKGIFSDWPATVTYYHNCLSKP